MNREQLVEHLTFAAELGVTGVSRDPAWRRREDPSGAVTVIAPSGPSEPAPLPASAAAPLAIVRAEETLAAIRAEIGEDCSRCKLHTLGRKQIVFGVGNPHAEL